MDATMNPSTPTPDSPAFPSSSSPSAFSVTTPPESVRQYSNALKAFTRVGMDAAMAELHDDTRDTERRFDVEFGYDDEDPIERHVRMYLTPNKGKRQDEVKAGGRLGRIVVETSRKSSEEAEDQDMLHVDVEMDIDGRSISPAGNQEQTMMDAAPDSPPRPFRPGLIPFHRSSRGSVPSLTNSAPSYTRTDSSSSTPFGFDSDGRVYCANDTPGSSWSESSFEAMKADDWLSLYGTNARSRPEAKRQGSYRHEPRDYFGNYAAKAQPDPVAGSGPDRSSIASTLTITSTASTISGSGQNANPGNSSKRPSLVRPRPRAYPYPPPPETLRSRENSGRTEVADMDFRSFSPEPRSRQSSGNYTCTAGSPLDAPPGPVVGDSRSRQSSDNVPIAKLAGLSCRSRQNSGEVQTTTIGGGNAGFSSLGLGVPMSEDDADWMSGRTISETMVVQAGFRSQRGRDSVRVVR